MKSIHTKIQNRGDSDELSTNNPGERLIFRGILLTENFIYIYNRLL